MSDLQIPGWELLRRGKVREVYASGDRVLLVASDRLSAFDCVLPDPIPGKGEILTALSAFWFQRLDFVPSHFIAADFALFPAELRPFAAPLAGRATLARRTRPLPVECVVRGYLAGAAWEEYRDRGTAGGHELPRGLRQASKLPAPIFTPTTKATSGHDEPITWEQCRRLLGDEVAHQVREVSFEVYDHGRAHAARAGLVIADTKLEFGLVDDELLLIDECLTPDSSRFWPAGHWEPGAPPPSFDKQFVRDYLTRSGWNRQPPAPHLPPEIIAQTAAKYREAFERLALGRRHE
ncbi:MAG: phosphoribosylaminoimidazolesuccinocarboxamide synthase [Chthoniobacterales bacterium]|nr:phosphoribosylaminoimidazolesuccinocarboxamide synthase [Chthoniobacterales bacterium]